MTQVIQDYVQSVEVLDPISAGGLQVFGLCLPDERALDYETMEAALKADTFVVQEINEGGRVPNLKVINKGQHMVFLMAGEQLIGAKQNRVLNTSLMVDAESELVIPVSCVEAGRWAYRGRSFSSSGTASHHKLRHLMARHAHDGYRRRQSPDSNQREVWDEVTTKLGKMGSRSPSAALEQVYEDHRNSLNRMIEELKPPEGSSGAVFVIHGRVAGIDLFDRPSTFAQLWPKLIRSYGIDALEVSDQNAEPITKEAVTEWMRSVSQTKSEIFKSPGRGIDVRMEGRGMEGASLVVEDQPVHILVFADVDAEKE